MRVLLSALAVFGVVVLAGCSSSPTAGSSTSSSPSPGVEELMVEMVDDQFVDGNVTVGVGSSIMYMNEGQKGHTVTIHWVGDPVAVTKLDKVLQPGEDATYTFSQAGTYHVWCRFHGQMTSGMASVVTVR